MNIHDLESFKLSDTVKFHDTLNPNLFTDEKMQDDVREQLLLIAEDFIEFMGIDTLEVVDIRLYGSNAAYTYTTKSDIDLHVLVDMTDIADGEVYRELFNSKKQLYNDSLNITIHGMPVELYMQDANQPVKSLGDYSISRDKWVKFPTKSKASFEETSVIEKFKRLAVLSELALRSDDIDLLDKLIDTIRRYRKAGLEQGGEFSPENLAYKSLRNRGIVEKLYDRRDELHSEYLSIDEEVISQQDDAENRLMNEFKKFMAPKSSVSEAFDQPYNLKWEKSHHDDWSALAKLPDGSPLSITFSQRKGAKGEKVVEVEFYRNNSQEVTLEGDAQRVFATVLFAMQQYIEKYSPSTMVFGASKSIDPSVMYEPDGPQPNPESRAKLYDRLVQRYAKSWGYKAFRSDNRDLVIYELSRINKKVAESSGYIPSESEKNDPRFSRALSVDVHPQTMKRQAKDMGLGNIARDGRPQRMNTSGKFTR